MNEEDWTRTISVSSKGITPKVKKLNVKEKELLINSGQHSAKLYLNQKSKKAYTKPKTDKSPLFP